MTMTAVVQSDHLVGVLMKSCWVDARPSWKQLWGVCPLWCYVWLTNDQTWIVDRLVHV